MKDDNHTKPARHRTLTILVVVGIFVATVTLIGCGQKGSLYLPDDTKASFAPE